GSVRIWDVATGTVVAIAQESISFPVRAVAFSPDGRHLASVTSQGLTIRDAATAQRVRKIDDFDDVVESVVYSPDGRRLASAGFEAIRLWDPSTGQQALGLRGHTDVVWGLAFAPDGTRLASASFDSTVRIWDATPEHELIDRDEPAALVHPFCIRRIAF